MPRPKSVPKVVRLPQPVDPRDPLDVNTRLYNQASRLLEELERGDVAQRITLREWIAAIIAVGRIQTIFVGLRKEKPSDEHAGETVRRYAAAFKNDAGSRKKIAGPTPEPDEPDDWFERAGVTDADDDGDDSD